MGVWSWMGKREREATNGKNLVRDGTLRVLTLRVLHKFLLKELELSPLMHDG